jgi:hypothetical protein
VKDKTIEHAIYSRQIPLHGYLHRPHWAAYSMVAACQRLYGSESVLYSVRPRSGPLIAKGDLK